MTSHFCVRHAGTNRYVEKRTVSHRQTWSAERLRRLEESGIVVRTAVDTDRRKRTYRLTEKGRDLLKVMLEITAWSARHDPLSNTPATFLAQFESHRDAVIAQTTANIP